MDKSNTENNHTVMIPWTGSYDSTALVLKALSEGINIHTPYVFIANNMTNCSAELAARKRIHKYLSQIGIWKGESPYVSYTVDEHRPMDNSYSYPKWIVYSCLDLPIGIHEVWVGYTLSDRTAEGFNLDHHCNMINAMTSMVSLVHPRRNIEVKFPFYDTDKSEMLKYYKDLKTRKVFEMLANCGEDLSYESGCRCNKCLKLETLRTILDRKII